MSPPPVTHQSPQTIPTHARNGSELVSPVQAPYNSSLPPPPMPYGMPLPPLFPPVPMAVAPIPPPPPTQPTPVIYPAAPTSPVIQTNGIPIVHRRNSSSAHPQNGINGHAHPADSAPYNQNMQQVADIPFQRPPHRDTFGARRGGIRRISTVGMGRKPPCLFFPQGRCRNGSVLFVSAKFLYDIDFDVGRIADSHTFRPTRRCRFLLRTFKENFLDRDLP